MPCGLGIVNLDNGREQSEEKLILDMVKYDIEYVCQRKS
jgi:hypothetical protein